MNESFTGTQTATAGSNSNIETNSSSFSETESALGSYGNASYCYETYAHDYDSWTTHTVSANGPGSLSQSRNQHDMGHALGSLHAVFETFDSRLTYQLSTESYAHTDSSHSCATIDVQPALAMPDVNTQGLETAPAPSAPASQEAITLGTEERLAAMEGPGVYITQTQASSSDKMGMLDARLLLPESAVSPQALLQSVRESGSSVQNRVSFASASPSEPSASGASGSRGKVSFIGEAHQMIDALRWVKRGIDVSTFAGGAGLLVGPAASNPFMAWMMSAHGLDQNWKQRPGVYDAVARKVDAEMGGPRSRDPGRGTFCRIPEIPI